LKAQFYVSVFSTSITHHTSWYMCTSIVTGNWEGHNVHPQPSQTRNLLSSCCRAKNPLEVVTHNIFFGAGTTPNDRQQHGDTGIASNMRVGDDIPANPAFLLMSKFLDDAGDPEVGDTATPKSVGQAGPSHREFLFHQPRFGCNP
jgi:hypothetical protein